MRFAIIGGGTAAIKCLERLMREPGAELALVLADPSRETTGARLLDRANASNIKALSCPNANAPEIIQTLQAAHIDWLLSINNYQILKAPLLSCTRYGAVNLHHSALPAYGGLNSCSWAIINGEQSHGVTWHKVSAHIDGGDILAQAHFPLDNETTAIRAIMQVLQHGLTLFDTLITQLTHNNVISAPQKGSGSYYKANMLPYNGVFPMHASTEELDRLSRAICFHPLPNQFYRPTLTINGKTQEIESFKLIDTIPEMVPGQTIEQDGCIILRTDHACVSLEIHDNSSN